MRWLRYGVLAFLSEISIAFNVRFFFKRTPRCIIRRSNSCASAPPSSIVDRQNVREEQKWRHSRQTYRQSHGRGSFAPSNRRLWRHCVFRRSKPWNGDTFVSPPGGRHFLTCEILTITTAPYKKKKCIDLLIQLTLRKKSLQSHLKQQRWWSQS